MTAIRLQTNIGKNRLEQYLYSRESNLTYIIVDYFCILHCGTFPFNKTKF